MRGEPAPEPGEIQFTDNGDVEIFDGESWSPISPIHADADGGIRNSPGVEEVRTAQDAEAEHPRPV
jgi:hypothetical protein